MKHGTKSCYVNRGCRCAPCRQANREYQRRANRSRAERLAADPTLAIHGSDSTYLNWGCRCAPCKAAWSVRMRAYYLRRRSA